MERKLKVGLFNDSFPPTIDGVANVTKNYAEIIDKELGEAIVATPYYPNVKDDYPFEVIRYPSAYIKNSLGYRAGYPFDPVVLNELENKKIDIIHTHCPVISTVLARVLRKMTGAPIVFTYHTKFDIDIENLTASDSLRKMSIKFLLNNINACDEVWVVSEGAGENLRSIGYTGDYIVMENGTDFERREAEKELVEELRQKHAIPSEMPVFLFVGRMMWYKGVKISLNGLKKAKEKGEKFKYILVGDGADKAEIEAYIEEIGMQDDCIMTGAVRDRELLRAYFTLADLFLFPSSFDTNGIVVREAAACYCPSLLLAGSCAAEGIEDGVTGIIIEENADAMEQKVSYACSHRNELKNIGKNAADKIYISWEDAVKKAYARYQTILENYHKPKEENEDTSLSEAMNSAFVQVIDGWNETKDFLHNLFWSTRDNVEHLKSSGKLRTFNIFDMFNSDIK